MSKQQNNHLILKVLIIGGLITVLIYLFHPGIGQFGLIINGEPVADPLVRFAAIPTLLIVMLFTGMLIFVAFLGVGMFMFIAALAFIMLGVFIVAPYFWPMLMIIFLVIALMSFGNTKNS
jgi:hypothetical protein